MRYYPSCHKRLISFLTRSSKFSSQPTSSPLLPLVSLFIISSSSFFSYFPTRETAISQPINTADSFRPGHPIYFIRHPQALRVMYSRPGATQGEAQEYPRRIFHLLFFSGPYSIKKQFPCFENS